MHDDTSPLPSGWSEAFTREVDLEASFEALGGIEHFFVESLRGRIRSLQMRFEEAWAHFRRAAILLDGVEPSLENLVRAFLLEVYRFHTALFEAPIELAVSPPSLALPEISEAVESEFAEIRYVYLLRKQCEALLRLHLFENEEALRHYEEILDDRQHKPEDLALCYVGKAGCLFNRGETQAVPALLEAAGLAAASQTQTMKRLLIASRLVTFYELLGDSERAEGWAEFLAGLPCPRVTRELFLARATHMLEMSVVTERVLIV